ncbi:MAG: hypothetical protein D6718_02190, partial [Acidobacteria bacterium]
MSHHMSRSADSRFPVFWIRALGLAIAAGSILLIVPAAMAQGPPCLDQDGDGYVVCDGVCDPGELSCGDCDDFDNAVHPGATEVLCDGVNQNCLGMTEDHPDNDGDGYDVCSPDQAGDSDGLPADCADSDPAAHPGATEQCDNIDNDCDGTVDSFTTTCGVGACAATGTCTNGVDSCQPGTPSEEICDNVDNDCDGTVDSFTTTCGVGA